MSASHCDIVLSPARATDEEQIREALINSGIAPNTPFKVIRRSIDARGKQVRIRLRCVLGAEANAAHGFVLCDGNVSRAPEVHIVGMGPCGLFAAIKLIELGYKPVLIDRGKDVRSRRRDLAAINKQHLVNPDSNYCFGEGGAGTYSDGKLYTRSKKRGNVLRILEILVAFGASTDILIDAHPHIGTNKLPGLITRIREYILSCGGEIHFSRKLTDLRVQGNRLSAIQLDAKEWLPCKALILATGHSARDIFELLHLRGIAIEAKDFALGVRVEHPQQLIDAVQYHCSSSRDPYLPPASYSLAAQVQGRGVYSFCMCPGGIIAPCATAPGEIVTNGWSPSKRNNPFANSGMVVSITAKDYSARDGANPLAALRYQADVERRAWELGGGGQTAPAQRLVDFAERRHSSSLPKNSYLPGLKSAMLSECLPAAVYRSLAQALPQFGKKMRGYYSNEAIVVATESRTSSPVRIPRNEGLEHPAVQGLFPAGEGAGYAGGIVSAAMDGERVADAVAMRLAAKSNKR